MTGISSRCPRRCAYQAGLALLLAAVCAGPVTAQDACSLPEQVDSAIAHSVESNEGGREPGCEYRLAGSGDLDGDGVEDLVVTFTIEGPGNGYAYYLMAFLGRNLSPTKPEVFGGKWGAHPEALSIRNRQAVIDVLTHAENDPACCPSVKGQLKYNLKGGQLTQVKG